jgi:hypothetical protein
MGIQVLHSALVLNKQSTFAQPYAFNLKHECRLLEKDEDILQDYDH